MTPKIPFARAAFAACILALAAPATAQPLQTAGPPADFPPEGYEERQFVDSRGCVYVRAGVDGSVTWVPRVNRDREQLCGFQPTFADAPSPEPAPQAPAETEVAEETATGSQPAPETAPPAQSEAEETAERRPAAGEQPRQQRVQPARAPERIEVPRRTPAPAPRATADPLQTIASAPALQRRVTPVPAPRPQRATAKQPAEATGIQCSGGTSVSSRYLVGREGERLRCSPQSRAPYSYRIMTSAEAEGVPENTRVYRYDAADAGGEAKVYCSVSGRPVSGEARVLPRHLWQPPLPDSARVDVPEGYEPAWEDGRLNPRRAEQTLNGRERMLLVWTNTTPRRLIDRASGEDMTARHPRLFYPFTDIATQNAYLSAKDELEVRVAADGRVRLVQKPEAQPRTASRSAPQRPVNASAQPAQKSMSPAAAGGHRFVQVGTFGVQANAQRTAARLQSMGLPVRLSRLTRGGKSYQVVLAGPFAHEAELRSALGTAHRAGFADAFPRK